MSDSLASFCAAVLQAGGEITFTRQELRGRFRLQRRMDPATHAVTFAVTREPDLPGWDVNRSNLNHLRDPGGIHYRARMEEPGTASLFRSITQTTVLGGAVRQMSYREAMEIAARSRSFLSALGYLPSP